MNLKLIMSDIDGCLLEKGVIPSIEHIALFQRYARMARLKDSLPLVICTGRGAEYVQPLSQIFGIMDKNELPSVVENGSFLYYPFSRRMLPHPALEGKEEFVVSVKESLLKKMVKNGRGVIIPGKEGSVSLIPPDDAKPCDFVDEVKAAIPSAWMDLLSFAYSTVAVDVTVAGVNKGSVFSFYAQVTGIAAENILMIGDENNDLPILNVAGFVACPLNASQEVKNLVESRNGHVASENGMGGVLEIIARHSQ